ncbi:hypothetical protein [Brevibacillus antibioticus]|uniref:hypothetical protein n=1 Tax=Brevibacillus antibioticus TaxID=2570228 RepID=UPI001FCC5D63|nr:hypothetical protein [Brevibacillus antibioticus]
MIVAEQWPYVVSPLEKKNEFLLTIFAFPSLAEQGKSITTFQLREEFESIWQEIIQAVENQSIEQAKKVTADAIRSIHDCIRHQMYGVRQLVELCEVLELV